MIVCRNLAIDFESIISDVINVKPVIPATSSAAEELLSECVETWSSLIGDLDQSIEQSVTIAVDSMGITFDAYMEDVARNVSTTGACEV